jgi:hypothetical protein
MMLPTASIWIVTYNNAVDLHANLCSLIDTWDRSLLDLQVNVINNHSNFHLNSHFHSHVNVWHNVLRSDSSLGHLSRNYNQALIHGFGDLNQPLNDYVVTSQDDEIWQPTWCEHFLQQMQTYTFVTHQAGDGVVCYAPDAVKKIGLWDERFVPSFYHECDYFLRALIYNKHNSSVNDHHHSRVLNPVDFCLVEWPPANQQRLEAKNASLRESSVAWAVYRHKWMVSPLHWPQELIDCPPHSSRCVNYVLYPHFEMAVENLREKNYII